MSGIKQIEPKWTGMTTGWTEKSYFKIQGTCFLAQTNPFGLKSLCVVLCVLWYVEFPVI